MEKEKELKALREQVKKGSIQAAWRLAEAWKWGYYGPSDARRAARMYRICCRSRLPHLAAESYYRLGELYYYGLLNDKVEAQPQPQKAFYCFLKSAMLCPAAPAFSRLADMYRYGQAVGQNDSVALSLYRRAAAF